MDKVRSAKKRLEKLFHVLLEALCSVGHPVLFVLDDLQWSELFVMESMAHFAVNYVRSDASSRASGEGDRRGLLIAGTYRDNEPNQSNFLVGEGRAWQDEGQPLLRDSIPEIDYTKQTTLVFGQVLTVDVGRRRRRPANDLKWRRWTPDDGVRSPPPGADADA